MIDTRIGQYVLTRKLGAGGFGEVWCARHFRQPELQVAIKLVGPTLARDPQFVEALTQECVRLDGLDHPNIVRFRDLVMEDERVAMVLELLQGEDLQQRLRRGALSVEAATPIVEAMLEGLGYAHSKGVMHRDVKPSNVFCCEDGRIKLLDFGIARAADNTGATKSGHLLGTVNYMAPERFTGEGGQPAGDVYAAGLVFWELLTGRAACPDGEPGRKMGWHLAQGLDATKVRVALPAAPRWVSEVIGAMTSRQAADRPVDGAAALALLRRERARHVEGPVRPGKRPLPEEVEAPEVKRAREEAAREAGEEERAAVARKAADSAAKTAVDQRAAAVRKAADSAAKAAADQRKATETKRLAEARASESAAGGAAAKRVAAESTDAESSRSAGRRVGGAVLAWTVVTVACGTAFTATVALGSGIEAAVLDAGVPALMQCTAGIVVTAAVVGLSIALARGHRVSGVALLSPLLVPALVALPAGGWGRWAMTRAIDDNVPADQKAALFARAAANLLASGGAFALTTLPPALLIVFVATAVSLGQRPRAVWPVVAGGGIVLCMVLSPWAWFLADAEDPADALLRSLVYACVGGLAALAGVSLHSGRTALAPVAAAALVLVVFAVELGDATHLYSNLFSLVAVVATDQKHKVFVWGLEEIWSMRLLSLLECLAACALLVLHGARAGRGIPALAAAVGLGLLGVLVAWSTWPFSLIEAYWIP